MRTSKKKSTSGSLGPNQSECSSCGEVCYDDEIFNFYFDLEHRPTWKKPVCIRCFNVAKQMPEGMIMHLEQRMERKEITGWTEE